MLSYKMHFGDRFWDLYFTERNLKIQKNIVLAHNNKISMCFIFYFVFIQIFNVIKTCIEDMVLPK